MHRNFSCDSYAPLFLFSRPLLVPTRGGYFGIRSDRFRKKAQPSQKKMAVSEKRQNRFRKSAERFQKKSDAASEKERHRFIKKLQIQVPKCCFDSRAWTPRPRALDFDSSQLSETTVWKNSAGPFRYCFGAASGVVSGQFRGSFGEIFRGLFPEPFPDRGIQISFVTQRASSPSITIRRYICYKHDTLGCPMGSGTMNPRCIASAPPRRCLGIPSLMRRHHSVDAQASPG